MIYLAFAAYCLVVTLVTVAVLSVLFLIAAILGSVYAKNVFRAGDKTFAALLGFSGFLTLSAECGNPEAGTFWLGVGALIDEAFGENHCAEAWERETARLQRGIGAG